MYYYWIIIGLLCTLGPVSVYVTAGMIPYKYHASTCQKFNVFHMFLDRVGSYGSHKEIVMLLFILGDCSDNTHISNIIGLRK